jgi:hypothetical protein
MGFRRKNRQEHVPDMWLIRRVVGGNLAKQQFPVSSVNQALFFFAVIKVVVVVGILLAEVPFG